MLIFGKIFLIFQVTISVFLINIKRKLSNFNGSWLIIGNCSGILILFALLDGSLPPEKERSNTNKTYVYGGASLKQSSLSWTKASAFGMPVLGFISKKALSRAGFIRSVLSATVACLKQRPCPGAAGDSGP